MKMMIFLFAAFIGACDQDNTNVALSPDVEAKASIVSVVTSGNENEYTFQVGVLSPDTGCEQYADWWEVISEDGELLYRRILAHSHVNEQPFVRSGGGVAITAATVVIVRVHMNSSGYGMIGYKGSISQGFEEFEIAEGFASELETQTPLPDGCAF
ncbi:hypothetical protein SAMN06265376_11359 [Dokdonia pacifica]|uniref:Lipoprotein n=3 Tax=Dokdonia pacifica TaxID=1627892 RepID=A0A239E268_9FLAO|nr:hypothetical protein SAMN06265376_11359 [Dokdonia pacifica]